MAVASPSPFPSPERAFYGFACYLSSYAFFVIYVVWAFLPDEYLHYIGFSYFPQKYWAVAVPAYLLVGFVTTIILYFGANMLLVPNKADIKNLEDSYSLPVPSLPHQSSLPPIYDIPLEDVNRLMFSRTRKPQ